MSELGLVSEFGIYVPETAKNGKDAAYPTGKRRPFATSSAAKSPPGGRKKCTPSQLPFADCQAQGMSSTLPRPEMRQGMCLIKDYMSGGFLIDIQ